MATVWFRLRSKTATSPQIIYLILQDRRVEHKYPTGYKVEPLYWNPKSHRVKNTINVPERDVINEGLNSLEKQARLCFADTLTKCQPFTYEILKSHLEAFQGRGIAAKGQPEAPPPPDLFTFIRRFIAESPERTVEKTSMLVHPRTIQKYQSTLAVLEEFAKQYQRKVNFDTVDHEFYRDFTKWLQKRPHRKGIGYTPSAIGKHIATLKGFLTVATKEGENTKTDFKEFKADNFESDSVYLNETELDALAKFDFSGQPRLDKVRDLFLVGCWTGLRFSDIAQLKPELHIKNGEIVLEQYKGKKKVVVPLLPVVSGILEKYSGQLPAMISNQKFNDYIKEACQLAGLVELVEKGETRAGQRIYKTCQKWTLVSSHTARRSFATNLYERGLSASVIMPITGHRYEKDFFRYIKTTPERNSKLIKEALLTPAENQTSVNLKIQNDGK